MLSILASLKSCPAVNLSKDLMKHFWFCSVKIWTSLKLWASFYQKRKSHVRSWLKTDIYDQTYVRRDLFYQYRRKSAVSAKTNFSQKKKKKLYGCW